MEASYPVRSDTVQVMQSDKTPASKQKTLSFWSKGSLSFYMQTGGSVIGLRGTVLFVPYYCYELADGLGELLNPRRGLSRVF